jgi:hypothetical protein
MGTSDEQKFNFRPGQIYLATANRATKPQTYYDNLVFSLYPNEAVVAHGPKHKLRSVRCIG